MNSLWTVIAPDIYIRDFFSNSVSNCFNSSCSVSMILTKEGILASIPFAFLPCKLTTPVTTRSIALSVPVSCASNRDNQVVPCKNLIQSDLLRKTGTPVLVTVIGRIGSSRTMEHIIKWVGSSSSTFSRPFLLLSLSDDCPAKKKIWKS